MCAWPCPKQSVPVIVFGWIRPRVHLLDPLLRNDIAVFSVRLVVDDIIAGLRTGRSFLRTNRPCGLGFLCPDRRRLEIQPRTKHLVGSGKSLRVDRIRILVITDDSVARFVALLATPLAVCESVGLQVEANSKHLVARPLAVLLKFVHFGRRQFDY